MIKVDNGISIMSNAVYVKQGLESMFVKTKSKKKQQELARLVMAVSYIVSTVMREMPPTLQRTAEEVIKHFEKHEKRKRIVKPIDVAEVKAAHVQYMEGKI